ncbi:MAG: hypothetical protein U0414_06640 [Polyangiaceae bacterium]
MLLPVLAVFASAACASSTVPPGTVGPDGMKVCASEEEQRRMQAHIDGLYDRQYVRKTIEMSDGPVDCIDFDKQPGCQDPARPCPHEPPLPPGATEQPPAAPGGCPQGTIPISAPRIENMRHFCTLEEFFRK